MQEALERKARNSFIGLSFFTPERIRRLIQAGFAAACVLAGWRLYLFLLWVRGESADFVPRPPVTEGFLPISSLLGFKKLLLSGQWDLIHPAGLAIFLAALATALLARKSFCGYVCPVGLLSNGLETLGRKLGTLRRPPQMDRLADHGRQVWLSGLLPLLRPEHEPASGRGLSDQPVQSDG